MKKLFLLLILSLFSAQSITEKAAKATENDTEQSIEDELAAFEAELAAELGE